MCGSIKLYQVGKSKKRKGVGSNMGDKNYEFELTATMTAKGQVTIPKEVRDYLGVSEGETVSFKPTGEGVLIIGQKDSDTSTLNTVKRLSRQYRQMKVTSNIKGYGKTHLISKLILDKFYGHSEQEGILIVGRVQDKEKYAETLKGLEPEHRLAVRHMYPEDFLENMGGNINVRGYLAVIIVDDRIVYENQGETLSDIVDSTKATYYLEGSFKEYSPFKTYEPILSLNLTGRVRKDTHYNGSLQASEENYWESDDKFYKTKLI